MRLTAIEALRAVAALLVLVAHMTDMFTFTAGAAGVDLFFVISGFVMVYSSEPFYARPGGTLQFALRRLSRIVPLYWATTTVMLLFLSRADMSIGSALGSYFFVPYPRPSGSEFPINGVGWTLVVEMGFYLAFATFLFLPRAKSVLAACSLLAFLALLDRVFPIEQFGLFRLASGARISEMLWEFVFGMLIALAYRQGFRLRSTVALPLAAAGALAFVTTCWMAEPGYYRATIWGIPAALIVGGLVLSESRILSFRPLLLIGSASYALYLTHPIVLHWIGHRNIALQLAATIGFAIAVHLLLEKPLLRRLHARIGSSHLNLVDDVRAIGLERRGAQHRRAKRGGNTASVVAVRR